MLFTLHIQNIAIIDDVEIEFNNGLTVFSGETGAGKSILIGSINLLLGDRANRDLIRLGADRGQVSGVFYAETETQKEALSHLGIEPEEDGAVLLSRTLMRDGKNICKISGRTVTLSELKEVGSLLVNIHGQHDSQALLDPGSHIHFLDGFLKEEGALSLQQYQKAYGVYRELVKKASAQELDEREKARRIDNLTFEYNEISAAKLIPGEEEELKSKRDIVMHKKRLEEQVSTALSALCRDPEGKDALGALGVAEQNLADAFGLDPTLEDVYNRVASLAEETQEAAHGLRQYFDRLTEEDMPIDDIEARLDLIYRLKRKYGGSVEDVIAYSESCQAELYRLENAETEKAELEKAINKAESEALSLAASLRSLRQKAIEEVTKQINQTLHFLNMPGSDFAVEIKDTGLSPMGTELVTFTLKTNAGEEHKPLHKIVSGGELSRIMLAIKSVLTEGDACDTLIFDEIDSGVSGGAAQKIGKKLRELAKNKQVLCVTHLAQIAAMAHHHFLIEKAVENDRTATGIYPLTHQGRVKELARIISGDAVTETTIKQAEELLSYGDEYDS